MPGPIFSRRTATADTSRKARRLAGNLMPETGDVDELVQAVARYRGRRIVILAEELGVESPTGYWISTDDTEYLVHPVDANYDQRAVIICHELAHILLDHQPPGGVIDLDAVAPSISPAVAARFLTRHGFYDVMEADAENMATQLMAELTRRSDKHRLSKDNISARLR